MAKPTFTIPEKRVEFTGGYITVRGLDAEGLTHLVENYLADMIKAVADLGAKYPNIMARKVQGEAIMTLTKNFPEMVAEVISRCADDSDNIAEYRRLSFPVQLKALEAILTLTTAEAGGLKNLIAGLSNMLGEANLPTGPLKSRLQDIIGASEKVSPSASNTDTDTPAATH